MTELDENGSVGTQKVSQPALATLYRGHSLLFSAAGWAEPILGMKSSWSGRKFTMSLQTTLKKRKMGRSSMEKGAIANAQ